MAAETAINVLRTILRVVALAGCVLFSALFAIVMVSDTAVERAAQAFIKYEIEREVRKQFGKAADLSKGAQLLQQRFKADAAAAKAALDDELPQRIAEAIAAMCRLDCKQKLTASQSVTDEPHREIGKAEDRLTSLTRLVQGKYLGTLASLTRDTRIFTGSNALLFALVAALAWIKPQASFQLYVPASLLLASTLISASLYVFGQNWFFTLLHNDFMGFGYLAYASLLFAFLCDIAMNRARVTTRILMIIGAITGAALSVTAC